MSRVIPLLTLYPCSVEPYVLSRNNILLKAVADGQYILRREPQGLGAQLVDGWVGLADADHCRFDDGLENSVESHLVEDYIKIAIEIAHHHEWSPLLQLQKNLAVAGRNLLYPSVDIIEDGTLLAGEVEIARADDALVLKILELDTQFYGQRLSEA